MANLFGLVATGNSRDYLRNTLDSFFRHTALAPGDLLVVVDGDGTLDPTDLGASAGRVTVATAAPSRGFAANTNVLLAMARERQADLVLLHDDIRLTAGWLEPLLDGPGITCAASNAEYPYRFGRLELRAAMTLDDVAGRDAELAQIAAAHVSQHKTRRPVDAASFHCARIPREVYERVGPFDEEYGNRGTEERDYAVRAWLAGIPVEVAHGALVLDFQGRADAEKAAAGRAGRQAEDTRHFTAKWGAALTYALLGNDWNLFLSDPALCLAVTTGRFGDAIAQLRAHPALEPFIERQLHARFAAVCCIYDDEAWLEPTIASVYDGCDAIVFLLGNRPWNGVASDQGGLVRKIEGLPDPARKIRLVRGDWPTEAEQRNAGLAMLRREGIDYCFVLDADEIYDGRQLARAMDLVRQNPQVDCWRAGWFTYWKSSRYRVEPPETSLPAVFARPATVRFVENRAVACAREAVVPADTLMIHHMSYARSDQQILRKITTFSHAHQIVPGWYERVWKGWDEDKAMENVHPCWPGAYRRIIPQPYAALPPVLQRVRDTEGAGAPRA